MMEKNAVYLFILIIAFSSAVPFKPRLKRSSKIEFNYSSIGTEENPIKMDRLFFNQKLQHFEPLDVREWKQRYTVTVDFYKKDGPAFLYIYGSKPMYRGYEFPNNMLSYAKSLNAICFSLEHRFYGRTKPINGSIIKHLSTAQALEDIRNFIEGATKEFHLPKHIKWIVFGCSYGGVLATWAKKIFPIIHGAVVSGAPLEAKVDYYEYEQIVEESLRLYDPKCVDSITVGFEEISHLVNSTENIKHILQMFDLDDETFNDFTSIKTEICRIMLGIISNVVQGVEHVSVPRLCRSMMDNIKKLEAFAVIKKMYDMKRKKRDVKIPSQKSQVSTHSRALELIETWKYQLCSEFGYFSSYTNVTFLSAVKHLLTPIETAIKNRCEPFFGPNFSIEDMAQNVNRTNSRYGGLNFNVCNTIFIHGSLDPWHRAGIVKKLNSSLYDAILIKGTSHCDDTRSPKDEDIPELQNARIKVFRTLESWLKEKSTTISSVN